MIGGVAATGRAAGTDGTGTPVVPPSLCPRFADAAAAARSEVRMSDVPPPANEVAKSSS